jgi:catechol 2,3-dioxygenase-like lactoylglutathione lyase family enzyme
MARHILLDGPLLQSILRCRGRANPRAGISVAHWRAAHQTAGRQFETQRILIVKVIGFDHLVLTVASIERTVAFYTRALGMTHEVFGPDKRSALRFGAHKINLHQADNMFEPRAVHPQTGSGDICLLVDDFEGIEAQLAAAGVPILVPPSERTGARGTLRSIYLRDPDGNLVELSTYKDPRLLAAEARHVS